jgi:hypothetical protein
MILWQSLLTRFDEKEKKKVKTITGHMQNRSVADHLYSRRKFIITNINKVYSKITTVSF